MELKLPSTLRSLATRPVSCAVLVTLPAKYAYLDYVLLYSHCTRYTMYILYSYMYSMYVLSVQN